MGDHVRHAFVTGGGSGIGLAVATALSRGGWRITIAGRDRHRLESAARVIGGAHVQPLDVTDSVAVAEAMRAAVDAQGPLSLLVNNAGGVSSAPFEKTTLDTWRRTLDVNLMGVVHCSQAALPAMKAAGWGRIVNIASTAGLVGYRYVSAYVAAKHAVVGLTKALALEVAKMNVTVNAICPGYTDTDLVSSAVKTIAAATKRTDDEALASFTAVNPQGRLVRPQEVAAAVLWLVSDEAASVNGVALPIAGGEVG